MWNPPKYYVISPYNGGTFDEASPSRGMEDMSFVIIA